MGLQISSKPPVMTLKKSVDSAEPRPAPRMAAEDRREQIIEVAVRLFSQRGFRGTTTKEIAAAAGVNEAIIFRHFSTKSELYAAIIDRKANSAAVKALRSALAEAIEQSEDPMVAVRCFMGMIIVQVMNKKFFLCAEGQMTPNITNRQAAAAFTDLFLASMTNHDYVGGRPRRKH